MAAFKSSGPELSDRTSGDSGNEDGEELCENLSDEENLNYGDDSGGEGFEDSDFDDSVVQCYDEVLRMGPLHDSVQAGVQNRVVDAQNVQTIEIFVVQKWTLLRARRVLLAQPRLGEFVDAKIYVEQCL